MRVIAGRFKGRRLVPFKHKGLRPTTDFVKESLFNQLASRIPGARVLDLFAGTGSLSIEALSRGAQEVMAVEKHPQSLKVLFKNLEHLKITEGVQVFKDDVVKFLKIYKGPPFDIILIDPPFTQKMAHTTMAVLSSSSLATPTTFVMIEASQKERLDERYGSFELFNQKKYNDKKVSFFEVKL